MSRIDTFNMAAAGAIGIGLVALSPFLMPAAHELGTIFLRDKEFDRALAVFEGEYKAGSRQVDVIAPLAKLYIQYGDVEGAIHIMEDFDRRSPNNPAILSQLGQYYQFAQRPVDYLHTLERLRTLAPTADTLRALGQIYNFTGRYADQIDVLYQIIQSGWATPEDAKAIAYLEAARGHADAALDVFKGRSMRLDPDIIQLQLSLMVDAQRTEEAVALVHEWHRAPTDGLALGDILDLLETKGRPDTALAILEHEFQAGSAPPPEMRTRRAILLALAGRAAEAYRELSPEATSGTLSPRALEAFVDAGLATGHVGEVVEAVTKAGRTVAADTVLAAIDGALTAGAMEVLSPLLSAIDEKSQARQPVLMARVALARGDELEADRWIRRASDGSLGIRQELQLAQLLVGAGRREGVDRLASLAANPSLPADMLPSLAIEFVRAGAVARGSALLARRAEPSDKADAESLSVARTMLGSAAGDADTVARWLNGQPALAAAAQVFEAAREARAWSAAVPVAVYLDQRQGDLESKLRLLQAYAGAGAGAKEPLAGAVAMVAAARPTDPALAERLVVALIDAGAPGAALDVLELFASRLDTSPRLLVPWTRAMILDGRQEAAHRRLAALVEQNRLAPEALPALVEVALASGRWRGLVQDQERFMLMPDWARASLVEVAVAAGGAGDVERLIGWLPNGFLARHPLLAAEVALLRGHREEAVRVLDGSMVASVTAPGEVVRLARLWQRIGDVRASRLVLDRIRGRHGLPDGLLPGLAAAYVGAGQVAEGLRHVALLRGDRDSRAGAFAWATLAAAGGDHASVAKWAGATEFTEADRSLLRDLYFSMRAAKANAAALSVAQVLWSLGRDEGDRPIVAQAYLDAGRLRDALEASAPLDLGNSATRSVRLAVLMAGVKAGLVDKAPIVGLLTEELRGAGATDRQRILYDLQALGAHEALLPHLATLARQGGAWGAMYMDSLAALGRDADLLAFVSARALDAATPEKERRELAHRLLANGRKDAAVKVFQVLAASGGPDGSDLKELRFLWGPRPDAEAVAWLADHARAATGARRAGWLDTMREAGAVREAIAILDEAPDGIGRDRRLRAAAVRLHASVFDKKKLRLLLEEAVRDETDPPTLRDYLKIAQNARMPELATTFGLAILRSDQADAETLRTLGHIAYGREDYKEANGFLERYFRTKPDGDFESNFYMAEIMGREKNTLGARKHYERSISQIEAEAKKDFFMRHLRGLLFQRLQRYEHAELVFRSLLAENPNHDGLRGDLAETLLLQKAPQRARDSLEAGRRR